MKLSVSPSASLKLLDKLTVCAPPATVSVTLESDPVGAVFNTVTEKATFAHLPEGSVAVMVIFVFPGATGVILNTRTRVGGPPPGGNTNLRPSPIVATDVLLDSSEYESVSPSGSLKMLDGSFVTAPPLLVMLIA